MDMKLLIITSIKEYQSKVAEIFKEAGIQVFSVSEIVGFKENPASSLADSWFAGSGDSYDSMMLFSFTDNEKAQAALSLITAYNKNTEALFPIRGFILPVEQSGY
jgi:hypothetical protein